jgi:glycosyltransferase involved in cell wall biosynthesis
MRLVVIPSKSEGLPNVLLEAISCGTPVLATPVGGIPDVIQDNVTGFLLPTLEKEEIAKKVLKALSDKDILKTVAQNAKSLLVEKYSFEASVSSFAAIICGLQK